MIDVARRKGIAVRNVRFDVGIAERLPYPEESFDCAFSTFFFHHIDRSLKEMVLSELWRVLKKGGTIVIIDVDIPTNLFGKICAWSGYYLFRQEEIRENIEGHLRSSIKASPFEDYEIVSRHLGYITVFKMIKQEGI